MALCFGKSRKHRRENDGGHKNDTYSLWALRDGSFDGELVEEPDRHHEEDQDDGGNDHGYAGRDTVAVKIVDGWIFRLLFDFLVSH